MREKIILGGYEMWLDRTKYPTLMLYDTETARHGIPVDVLCDTGIGSPDLNDAEKVELMNYLNANPV